MPLSLPELTVTNIITSLGALGTASFGLVDASKAAGGGVSNVGVGDISAALKPLFGGTPSETDRSTPFTYASIRDNLRANWMNGTLLADQKAIAKTLTKLRLNSNTAPQLAQATGVEPDMLAVIATAINTGQALTTEQADCFGRFDLALTSLFDQAYQRADQRYRNCAKLLAGLCSIIVAVIAGYLYQYQAGNHSFRTYFSSQPFWVAFVAGALATPIAPVAKDLTSTLAAATNVLEKIRRK